MASFSWTTESTTVLRDQTREHKFDFEKVAFAIRVLYKHLNCEVTSSDCRVAYANNYLSNTIENESDATDLDIGDSMSFEEIMDVVAIRNDRSEQRNRKVFDRVLASLGSVSESLPLEESIELEKIRSNLLERKYQKQMERERIENRALKAEENKWIASEREKLRQRHLPDFANSEGSDGEQEWVQEPELELESESESGPGRDGLSESSSTQGQNQNQSTLFTELFGFDNLDSVLEEIERELDARAGSKDDASCDNSELSQVLAFLDDAADKRKTTAVSPVLPTVSVFVSPPAVRIALRQECDTKCIERCTPTVTSNAHVAVSSRPNTTDCVESVGTGSQRNRAVQDPRGDRGGRGQRDPRSRSSTELPTHSKEEESKGSDAENKSGENSAEDDSDDDWADIRSKMKSKASHCVFSSSSSSSSSLLIGNNIARVESAAAVVVNTDGSSSSAGDVAADSISATAAPVPDSKHGLNTPSNCISDMIEPVLTASYINNPPGTACASPSKALSVEHGQILINDGEVFGGQEVQHHLSGSLLTGRSGAASRKKPTARALQPRAATVPDSRI